MILLCCLCVGQAGAFQEQYLDITLSAVDAQGVSITSNESKASKTSTIHILIDEHINLSN